jgi:hypothetical protein
MEVLMEDGQKCCQECAAILDDTEANFARGEDGELSVACISCVREQKRRVRLKAKEAAKANARKLKEMEAAAVTGLIQNAVRGGSNIPHSAELLEQVMTYFGGVSGCAALMVKQYFDARPGSTQRGRTMEMVTRLVQKNVDQGGAQKPLTLWSEEELEEELNDRFRRVVLEGRVIDGKEGEIPTGNAITSSEDHLPIRIESMESSPDGDSRAAHRSFTALPPDAAAGLDAPLPSE